MGDRAAKAALFAEFAATGKALSNPSRLVLLDLLAQGPRSVEELAAAADLAVGTCSAHLKTLRAAGMVSTRRDGKHVFYSLTGDDVAALFAQLRTVAQGHRPHTELARRAYLGPDDTTPVSTQELLNRLGDGHTVILDVRPGTEYHAGHLPGAVNIPLDELANRLAELPPGADIVAYCRGRYCVLAHEAARLLANHGMPARRAEDGVLEWRITGTAKLGGAA